MSQTYTHIPLQAPDNWDIDHGVPFKIHTHGHIPHDLSFTKISKYNYPHPSATSPLVCCFPDSSAASAYSFNASAQKSTWLRGGKLGHLRRRTEHCLKPPFPLHTDFSPHSAPLPSRPRLISPHPLLPSTWTTCPCYVLFSQLHICF